jgi:hypothetical protein
MNMSPVFVSSARDVPPMCFWSMNGKIASSAPRPCPKEQRRTDENVWYGALLSALGEVGLDLIALGVHVKPVET